MTETKIPKIIHYFYDSNADIFEKNNRPQLRMCYTSWKMFCPDYEIMFWHDKMPEFQEMLKASRFLREAYRLKIWAFVSDYVRFYALYKYGGIYLDTDVQIIKNIDEFLDNEFFCSVYGCMTQPNYLVEPALTGSVKGNTIAKIMLDYYNSEEIFNAKNIMLPVIFRQILQKNNLLPENENYLEDSLKPIMEVDFDEYKSQEIYKGTNLTLYPMFYFCPSWEFHREKSILQETHAIHWCQSSWWYTLKNKIDVYELQHLGKAKGLKKLYRKIRIILYRIANSCCF